MALHGPDRYFDAGEGGNVRGRRPHRPGGGPPGQCGREPQYPTLNVASARSVAVEIGSIRSAYPLCLM